MIQLLSHIVGRKVFEMWGGYIASLKEIDIHLWLLQLFQAFLKHLRTSYLTVIRRQFFDLLVHKIADVYLHHPAPKKNLIFIVFFIIAAESPNLWNNYFFASGVHLNFQGLMLDVLGKMDTFYKISIIFIDDLIVLVVPQYS